MLLFVLLCKNCSSVATFSEDFTLTAVFLKIGIVWRMSLREWLMVVIKALFTCLDVIVDNLL